jgi:histidinol-phosphatase (PHP family)
MLVDGHMHLEYGDLTVEYVMEFVNAAIEKGLSKIQILDHTHRFKEFEPIYEDVRKANRFQEEWLLDEKMKFHSSLEEYVQLIKKVKLIDLPIEVSFGLEVCYVPKYEEKIKQILKDYQFDFLVGAIHSIDGVLYDMKWSEELLWSRYDIDYIYRRYYELLFQCIESDIFSQLAHPDTIKMFNHYPLYDLTNTYFQLAQLCNIHHVKIENNTGCFYRYNHQDMGLSDELLKILVSNKTNIITCSDAHHPNHVGSYIEEANKKINNLINVKSKDNEF